MTAQKIIQKMDETLFANASHFVGSILEKIPFLSDMSKNYRLEPPAMTVKHVLQEGPNSHEIFGFAPMKFLVKGVIQYIAQHTSLKYLEDSLDASYLDPISDGMKWAYNYWTGAFSEYTAYIMDILCFYP